MEKKEIVYLKIGDKVIVNHTCKEPGLVGSRRIVTRAYMDNDGTQKVFASKTKNGQNERLFSPSQLEKLEE